MKPVFWLTAALMLLGACSASSPKSNFTPGTFGTRGIENGGWFAGTAPEEGRARVRIVPPSGAPEALAGAIAHAVASHLAPLGVDATIANQPGDETFVLAGRAEPNTDPAVNYPVILSWLVTDTNDRLIHSYALGVEGTAAEWGAADPAMVRAIGASTARPIASWVLGELGLVQAALPGGPRGGFGVLLSTIKGLGGADARALTLALKNALLKRDLLITEDPRQATYGLTGVVELSANATSVEGVERVRIVWRVFRGNRAIGRAVQETEVPRGALAGNWAEVAPAVAEGVADAIVRTLSGGGNAAFSAGQGSQPPETMLPQVPGRGPPPPP